MCLHKCKLNYLKNKCQEKWENAYLSAKSATVSGTLRSVPDPQLIECCICKLNQMNKFIFSDVFVKNGQNLSFLNSSFVMYPHKTIVKIWKKWKYQEKWENAFLTGKKPRASWILDPGWYWLPLLTQFPFTMSAKSRTKFLGPPLDQILDPLVQDLLKKWTEICSMILMMMQNGVGWGKGANISWGPGPAIGPWKLLHC